LILRQTVFLIPSVTSGFLSPLFFKGRDGSWCVHSPQIRTVLLLGFSLSFGRGTATPSSSRLDESASPSSGARKAPP